MSNTSTRGVGLSYTARDALVLAQTAPTWIDRLQSNTRVAELAKVWECNPSRRDLITGPLDLRAPMGPCMICGCPDDHNGVPHSLWALLERRKDPGRMRRG